MDKITVKADTYNLYGQKMKINLKIKSDRDFHVSGPDNLAMVDEICKAVQNIMENYAFLHPTNNTPTT